MEGGQPALAVGLRRWRSVISAMRSEMLRVVVVYRSLKWDL